jgi:hypothetical protein
MAYRKVIWSSADPSLNKAKLQLFQYNLNSYLSIKNQVEIVMIADDWYAFVGTDESKKRLDKMIADSKKPRVDFIAK